MKKRAILIRHTLSGLMLIIAMAVCFARGADATVLEITPANNFEPLGKQGGPFTPYSKDYQLTNTGPSLLYWGADKTASWLNLGPETGGQLQPNQSTIVTVSLTSEANSLPEGIYTDTLTFTDLTNNENQTRGVTLTIAPPRDIWVDPNSFDVNITEGTALTETLTIGNNGLDDLSFTIRNHIVGPLRQSVSEASSSGQSVKAFNSTSAKVTGLNLSVPKGLDFTKPANVPYKPGELIVHFAPKANGIQRNKQEKNQILNSLGAAAIKRNFKLVPGLSVVKLPPGMTVEKALPAFNKANGILYAQPNYQVKISSTFPNDTRFNELWGMHNTGQTGGTPDADIDAPEAWDITTGSSKIIVAVIDTGVDYTHPDLAANMWVNEAELNGTPGVDDDNNGFVDDIYGYDFCNNDGDPMDDHSHGTHCAGIIGAVGNNNVGVAGVCWNVRIMAIKFIDSGGSGYTSDAIAGVEYSILMGANLSSNSWGGGGYDQALKDAIDAAGAAGMLFVTSAGNDVSNNDTYPVYPSSYDCESLISVMATDKNDDKSSFSNYGPTSVDLGAPGSSILSCKPGNSYQYLSGTSMAAPHVAGACALLWSMNPMLSNIEVKNILLQTVDKTLPGLCVSEGRLNLYNAILATKAPWLQIEPEEGTIAPRDSNQISVTFNAMTMEPGTYNAEILVLSNDPCHPTLVIPVTMTVNADTLAVTPAEDFQSRGTEGGPFEPQCMTYTLTNNGIEPVDWTAAWTKNWLSVAPHEGTLNPNESIEVDVCIDHNADLLDPNTYTDTVIFQNLNSTSIKPRSVTLRVKPPDCFTELFDSGSDLKSLSLTFTPNGSIAYYEACRERINEFPTDPNGGTYVPLGDDDFAEVILSNGKEILFYGQWYDRFYIGSNGYITFGTGDTEFVASLKNHFSMPRISALFTDLTPATSQSISYKQLDDRVVVTFQNVQLYGDETATNSFQVEMFFVDGTICISWLDIAATEAIAGLSKGTGLPVLFVESDLSSYPPCWPLGDFNRDYLVNFTDFAVLAMHWLDENCSIPFWCGRTDLDFSSTVDIADVGIFSENWLAKGDWWLQPISHWKFDEGEGDIAHDSAGNNHGTLKGNSQWVDGKIGSYALLFDGNGDYVETPLVMNLSDAWTVSIWLKSNEMTPGAPYHLGGSYYNGKIQIESRDDYDYGGFRFRYAVSGTEPVIATGVVNEGNWHHIVWYQHGGAVNSLWGLYVDGILVNETIVPVEKYANINFTIGREGSSSDYNGTIDDVRVYDRALSAEEIWQLYWEGMGEKAFNPYPTDGAANVNPNVVLSWSPGKNALSHDVYLGLDYNDVNSATPDSNEYTGNFDVNSYDPNGLEFKTTYYWRIDEKNISGTVKGDIWSFKTWAEPNLISWWKFDEGEGDIAYDSAGNNHGTIYGATWTPGQIDGALNFDGADDYVKVVDNQSQQITTNQMTLSAWIKLGADVGNTQRRIICKQDLINCHIAWGLEIFGAGYGSSGNQLVFHDSDGGTVFYVCISPTDLNPVQWYHVAATDNAGVIKIYIDGQIDCSSDGGFGIPSNVNAPITIGTVPPGTNFFFNGTIDDVRLYNRALSAEEVRQLYQQGL